MSFSRFSLIISTVLAHPPPVTSRLQFFCSCHYTHPFIPLFPCFHHSRFFSCTTPLSATPFAVGCAVFPPSGRMTSDPPHFPHGFWFFMLRRLFYAPSRLTSLATLHSHHTVPRLLPPAHPRYSSSLHLPSDTLSVSAAPCMLHPMRFLWPRSHFFGASHTRALCPPFTTCPLFRRRLEHFTLPSTRHPASRPSTLGAYNSTPLLCTHVDLSSSTRHTLHTGFLSGSMGHRRSVGVSGGIAHSALAGLPRAHHHLRPPLRFLHPITSATPPVFRIGHHPSILFWFVLPHLLTGGLAHYIAVRPCFVPRAALPPVQVFDALADRLCETSPGLVTP